ncbi:MAG: rhodanese-related sulfurtransferase [Bacteroidota bacterium]
MQPPYNILLYYCYATIEDPVAFRESHYRYCLEQGLKGRIIIAHEGINGTLSGPEAACAQYMSDLRADARFADTQFKVETHDRHAFKKLHVRTKPEIVHAGLPHIQPGTPKGKYIEPTELQRIKDEDDVVLLDVRSKYEHHIGHFKAAVTLDIDNFREFPEQMDKLTSLKDKKVVTYCTGGIKCEKASAYLLEQGFENVYQLHGGIIQYGLETDGKDFDGKCYVFDDRLTVNVNKANPSTVGQCYVCHTACDHMANCANLRCNRHVPLCADCRQQLQGACSPACQQIYLDNARLEAKSMNERRR